MALYLQGKYINGSGLGKETQAWRVPSEREREVVEAFDQTKKKPFLAIANDQKDRVRVIYAERLWKITPKQQPVVGIVLATCRLSDGTPMKMINFLNAVPKDARDEAITKLAMVHLFEVRQRESHLPR